MFFLIFQEIKFPGQVKSNAFRSRV